MISALDAFNEANRVPSGQDEFSGMVLPERPAPQQATTTRVQDIGNFIGDAVQDPNNIVMGSAEAPLVGLNQMLTGGAAMVAEPLAFSKNMALEMLGGRAFEQGTQGLSYLQNSWQKAIERSHVKGQEAAADVQRVLGYEPKTTIAKEQVLKPLEEVFSLPGKAANIKGDWYKPLGLSNIESTHPIAGHYLELAAMVFAGKAAHSATSAAKAKYSALAEKMRSVKETGEIPPDFDLLQEQADALAVKANQQGDLRKAQTAMAEHESRMAELRPKTPAEINQEQINQAIPQESPLATTPKERQQVISNTLADKERFPEQPARVVQPIDELVQAKEAEALIQGRKPLPTPTEVFNQNYSRAGLGEVPNVNDRWRTIFEKRVESPKPEVAPIPKANIKFTPMPEEASAVLKKSTQETVSVEEPRPERRSKEYVPSSSVATLEEFPVGRETSEVINRYRMDDQLYTTKGGNQEFIKHSGAAKVAKRVGGTVLPKENGKFVVAMEPQSRVMFERDAIRGESGRLAEKDATTSLKAVEVPETPIETVLEAKPKVPNTKLTQQLRDLGWNDEQIAEFSIGERKTIAKDKSVPIEREQDNYGSKAEGEAARKFIEETKSTGTDPDVAESALKAVVPELEKWTAGDESVDINAIREQIRKISDNFDPNNLSHDKVTLPADKLLSEISRTEMQRKGIKIEEELSPEDVAELQRVARSAELDKLRPSKAELDEIEKPVDREARKQEVRAKWEAIRASRSTPVDTPEKAIAIANNAKETQPRKMTARQKAEAETRAWEEANRDDPVLKEISKYENERALNLDEPAANIDATDLWGAFKSLLSNDEGQWTLRRGKDQPNNPVERLTPEHIGAIDKLYKVARRNGIDPVKLMKESGMSDELIAMAGKIYNDHIEPRAKLGLEPILQGPYKDRNPTEVVRQGKSRSYKGQVITTAPVMKSTAEAFGNMVDIPHVNRITNPLYVFKNMPEPIKKFYYDWRDAESRVYDRKKAILDRVDTAAKGISSKDMKAVFDYELAQQGVEGSPQRARAQEIVSALGIKPPKALSEKQMAFRDLAREIYKEMFQKTNEVRTAIGKNPIPEIENYVTFLRSFSLHERFAGKGSKRTNVILDDVSDIHNMHKAFEEAKFPFTKRDVKGSFAIERDYASVLKKYISAAIRQQEISPIMAEIAESIKPFSTNQVNAKTGKPKYFNPRGSIENTVEFLTEWSNHIGGVTPDVIDPKVRFVLQTLNKHLAWSTLSGNLTSTLMQPAAFANTIGQIGSYHTIKGISMSANPWAWKNALKESQVLKGMVAELEMYNESKITPTNLVKHPIATAARIGMQPLQWLDSQARMATWLGAKEYGSSRGLKGKELVKFADDVVTQTQASTLPGDVAKLQRTTIGRTIGQFQTFMINDWNFMNRELFGRGTDKPLVASKGDLEAGTLRKTARYVGAALMLNALYKHFNIRAPFPDVVGAVESGMENGDSALQIAWATAGELAEKLPFVGNIKYGKGLLPPILDTANKLLVESGPEVNKMLEEGKTPEKTIEGLLRLSGVPGTNQYMKAQRAANRGEEGFWDQAVGRYQKR